MNDNRPTPLKPPSSPIAAPGDAATFPPLASPDTTNLPVTSSGPTTGRNAPPPDRIGDYTIVRVLGEGGMGTVYLAEDSQLRRKAAIKTMKPELAAVPANRERFLREARAAAAVEHDNIVPIWGIGLAADGSPFIVMPFLQGEMLADRLKRESTSNLSILLKVAREVADGLAVAHAKGLIHRDIKPANVWVEGDPQSKDLAQQVRRCKILDFGLARCSGQEAHLTASGAILGTPAYMAPEQAYGEKVDHRADLFSLGVMLYRMATGKQPFEGPSMIAVLTALATVNPPPASSLNKNLPPALSDLIERLMCKDAGGRPQSAVEVAAAVRQIAKDLQAKKSAPPVAVSVPPLPPALPSKTLVAPAVDASSTMPSTGTRAAPRRRKAKTRSRMPWLIGLALLALVPLVVWLATVVLRVATPNGTLVVEINDAETEARIKNGKLILTDPDGKVRYTLTAKDRNKKLVAGLYKIRVEGVDGLTLDTAEFTLMKDGQVTVRVTLDVITNSIGMKLVRIPAGEFTMGSPPDEKDRVEHEGPQRSVKITKSFYMGVYEVTQGEYEKVMGSNPSYFSKEGDGKPQVDGKDTSRFPVESVSYEDAVKFCTKLSGLPKEKEKKHLYRLPSEAEWEYSCRGGPGLKTPFHFGKSLSSDQANFNGDYPYGGAAKSTNLGRSCKVGSYKPNSFGLYDMHGNVWEWCSDWYGADYYGKSPNRNPGGPSEGSDRVIRGGSWNSYGRFCRSANRISFTPTHRFNFLGFRVALVPSR